MTCKTDLIRIPQRFYDEHRERDLPASVVQRSSKRHDFIRADDPALDELMSDATHYASGAIDTRDFPHLFGLARVRARHAQRHPQIEGDPRMSFRITLQSKPSPHFGETTKRWQVLLNGEPWGEPFYYNMTGYRGVLPTPDGRSFDPGEVTLTRLRQEVAQINREARAAASTIPAAGA